MQLSIAFSLLFVAPLLSMAQSDSAASKRFYDIKSCRIVYKFYDGPQSGVKTLIFDDWGKEEKEEVTTVSDTGLMKQMLDVAGLPDSLRNMTIPGVQHTLLIRSAYKKYVINLDKKIGYQSTASMQQFGMNLFEQEAVIVGEDTLLGKRCVVKEIQKAFRLWIWHKIALKKIIIQKGSPLNVGEYATEIDENYVIKPNEFMVPKNITMR
jgi:hypothetical protein